MPFWAKRKQANNSDIGLSLSGDAGREVAINVARLTLGSQSIDELDDPCYRLDRDGTIMLRLDAESFAAVSTSG